jgi:hypothetical protein
LHIHTSRTKKRAVDRAPEPPGSAYPSLMPQVDYTDGPNSEDFGYNVLMS